jgi:phosphocarrier protein
VGEPISGQAVIVNDLGLHTRAATTLVKLSNTFSCDIKISVNGITANAKSIMGLLALGARKGTLVEIIASGEDQAAALEALQALFARGFNEGTP